MKGGHLVSAYTTRSESCGYWGNPMVEALTANARAVMQINYL